MRLIVMILAQHVERGGCHVDRFDASVNDIVVAVSRQPLRDAARELLARGFDPNTRLHVQHAGRVFDPSIVAQPIGELARWTYIESDRDGIRGVRWQPPEERSNASRRSTMASPAPAEALTGTQPHPAPGALAGAAGIRAA
jgi:hypothetical protein